MNYELNNSFVDSAESECQCFLFDVLVTAFFHHCQEILRFWEIHDRQRQISVGLAVAGNFLADERKNVEEIQFI